MIKLINKNIIQFSFKNFGSNVYLLKKEKILIDTSSKANRAELADDLGKLDVRPADVKKVLLTHGHWDHAGNIDGFPKAKIYAPMQEIRHFGLKNTLPLSALRIKDIEIIETPGHTRGSVAYYMPKEKILFSGDTIFDTQGMIGRTDLPESAPEKMNASVKKLLSLDFKILCPGH